MPTDSISPGVPSSTAYMPATDSFATTDRTRTDANVRVSGDAKLKAGTTQSVPEHQTQQPPPPPPSGIDGHDYDKYGILQNRCDHSPERHYWNVGEKVYPEVQDRDPSENI